MITLRRNKSSTTNNYISTSPTLYQLTVIGSNHTNQSMKLTVYNNSRSLQLVRYVDV